MISGLVPADVDHVTLSARGGTADPITIAVPEQVYNHELPEDFGRPVKVQWHASNGALLRTRELGR